MNATDLKSLEGKVVLVKSARDIHTPPVALRGSLEVRESADAPPTVRIVVDFPQMFTNPAHRRSYALNDADVARLLASESNGTFEFTVDEELL